MAILKGGADMSVKKNKIALVPAYKPDNTIIDVITGLNKNGFKIIVVDDGSGSDYRDVFARASEFAEVVELSENCGKGAALKAGTQYIKENFKPPYTVLTIDADGQHRVEDACRIADISVKNPDKLIIGKRNLNFEGTPLRSKVGNNITHFGFRQATLRHLNETQTG